MDTRLGLLSDNYNERSANLIQASKEAFRLFFELEFKPSLWRFFRTPNFKKLMNSFETITNISCEIIEEARERFNNRPEGSRSEDPGVLEKLLEIDPLLAKVMAIDMLFGGLDTVISCIHSSVHTVHQKNLFTDIFYSHRSSLFTRKKSRQAEHSS